MSPLLILATGVIIVLGMIIFFRINAFVALITAAMVVSVMAPGEVGSKISRVADAFGRSAGAIGIVIALAAIIGQCMMESGAADRIVRTFLKLLGEKRAPLALMGSGFILSVPVFFDTVFYLLIPLARSLHRRTNKNYLLYILAISAGGAITHTLVPPTPGPLLMASTLGVDVGLMILVGAMIALPAALVGIGFSLLADRIMNIPMRQSGTKPDPEPLEESQLPSLLAALSPILLPVVLISCNTVVETLADAERPGHLSKEDITDWPALSAALSDSQAGEIVLNELKSVGVDAVNTSPDDTEQESIITGLNRVLANRKLYPRQLPANKNQYPEYFAAQQAFNDALPSNWEADQAIHDDSVERPGSTQAREFYHLQAVLGARTKPVVTERMNRLLLEAMFPAVIRPHEWNTPLRKLSRWTSLAGNANLALLLAMSAALIVYVKQRKPTRKEMSASVESALMSGGAIILITAAGGAFGGMLDVAKVGPAIQGMFDTQGSGEGLFYLFLGFGMAALLKIAQGSGTTAMIVVSGMLAPTVADVALPFNAVYLATAIGAGSLVGSWMNDSGFWIVAKMSGLTEAEALRTWTPLLLVLGVTSMTATVILAMLLPLV